MLLVRTYIGPSTVHGTGLFTAESIAKGTLIWRYDPRFDRTFTREEIDDLPPTTQEFLATYSYKSRATARYIFCADHARHMNHSEEPNCGEQTLGIGLETATVALRDIAAGEELTEDYSSFEDAADPDNVLIAISRKMTDLRDPRLK